MPAQPTRHPQVPARNANGLKLRKIKEAVPIRERPPEIEDRAVPGHWESDLIVGTNNSDIATLVERHSRFVMLAKIANQDTQSVITVLIKQARKRSKELYRSLTWDRGPERTHHLTFSMATRIGAHFCDPHSPWQRGSNKNTNRLLRQCFPRGLDISTYSQAQRRCEATQRAASRDLAMGNTRPCNRKHRQESLPSVVTPSVEATETKQTCAQVSM
ncbi:hypothetical protein So717_20660 [Roseobacter cerasinus]|uniref:Integrase catalytic domain-containing protein n=1 Tax=Roseobacter cerasinus TaxID=2602289 RepID=A0A640VPY7_9RHOB|nr:hypothetical protein So717_20660 [Roseobacter cerasinus]